MSSSKALSSRQLSPVVSLTLKTVGIIIILAALVDIFVLPIPYQPLDRQWQINFVSQVVDRGIVPMIGIALILMSYWIDSVSGGKTGDRPSWQDLGFWALIFSSLLGLFFLLICPLHLNNVRVNQGDVLKRIDEQATQAEAQLNTRLQTEAGQQRQQLEQVLQNPGQLDQILNSGQLPPDQADQLKKLQQDPKSLDKFVQQRVGELQKRLQTEMGTRREQAIQSAKTDALKSGIRIGISTLLLAAGYIIIGWIGLRSWKTLSSNRAPS